MCIWGGPGYRNIVLSHVSGDPSCRNIVFSRVSGVPGYRNIVFSLASGSPGYRNIMFSHVSGCASYRNIAFSNVSTYPIYRNIVFLYVKMSTNGAFRPRTQAAICKPEMDNGVLHPWSQKVFHAYQGTQLRICIALEAKTHTHTRT